MSSQFATSTLPNPASPRATVTRETVAVAMSGGVDSSTVAAMLRAQGADVIGLTLQLWDQNRLAGKPGVPTRSTGRCCSLDDVYDARRVAESLDIPYYVVNQQERFERDVVRPFVDDYLAGRTPIPCSLCNNHLKFDQLLLTARQIGATRIATGHYARNEYDPARNRWILKRPADLAKDQTWFLFGLTQDQLAHTLFPLGDLTKPEVRQIARESHLALADKPDSQEICFIPGGDYKQFIANYLEEQGEALPDSAGELVSIAGASVGHHHGIHNFTVGQRKGLGVFAPNPLYVLQIDAASRRVTVGPETELNRPSLLVHRLNWIAIPGLEPGSRALLRAQVRIRHSQQPTPATLEAAGEDRVRVTFDEPQRAVTPGHSAVFYDNDEVLGGGWILPPEPQSAS
uniref:tRNA (5-methylaminomethyl-2-thiouridylate) methyltransferase n=1 Tax=mine drainage metagenome TaxID=410659 RepID=E6QM67_9ZZZZ